MSFSSLSLSPITIQPSEIQEHLKLSCQLPILIQEILTRKIIAEEANAYGITVSPEELQTGADQFRYLHKLQRSEETYTWLKQFWLTVDDFEVIIYESVLANKLSSHLFSDRVEAYFSHHQLDYWCAIYYEVVLDDRDLALELHCALQEQELSFYEVAQQYHKNREKQRMGGYCGKVRRDSLSSELSAAIFSAHAPQIIQPVLTPKGIHLIYVEELSPPTLDVALQAQILNQLFSEWIAKKLSSFHVEKFANLSPPEDLK